ncbi:MAG: hypothetical protein ABI321_19790 [Polyangia bacterium]
MTLCTEGTCRLVSELDLGNTDLAGVFSHDDLSVGDLATAPPDMVGFCGNDTALACPDTAPICAATQYCRACAVGDEVQCSARAITAPRCDTGTGACAACRPANEATDCPTAELSVCGSDGSCRKACTKHTDCDSGICDPGIITPSRSSCARPDEVVYVKAQSTCPPTADGTKANPLCTMNDVLAKLPKGGYVGLLPSPAGSLAQPKASYQAPYVIVGTGTLTGASFQAGMITFYPPAMSIDSGGNVYLSGVSFESSVSNGIVCSGGAKLTLSHVTLEKSGGGAVIGGDCEVAMDGVYVRGGAGGISQSAGTLSVTNSFVTDTTGQGLNIGPGVTVGQLAHLTIIANKPFVTTAGGIACGAAANIYNSIVRSNQQVGGSSISGACSFHYSDLDEAVATNDHNMTLAPRFIGPSGIPQIPFNYSLKKGDAANVACCFDLGATLSSIKADYSGNVRPLGAGYDIGADEVQ